jgi:hypothetical protein
MIRAALLKDKQQFSFSMEFLPGNPVSRQMPLVHEKPPKYANQG